MYFYISGNLLIYLFVIIQFHLRLFIYLFIIAREKREKNESRIEEKRWIKKEIG